MRTGSGSESIRYYSILSFVIAILLTPGFRGECQVRNLDYYINESLRNSPLLNDLQNQINSASIDSLITLAKRKPQVEWRSGLLYSPYNDHFGYDEVITDGGNYQAVGFVSQNIFNRKLISNELNSITTRKSGLGINKKLTTAELEKTITNIYITAYQVYTDFSFNRSFLDLMNEENQIVEKLVKAGIYSQSDLLALQVETEGQKILVSQLDNEFKKEIRLLNEACGVADTSSVILMKPEIEMSGLVNDSEYLLLEPYKIDSLNIINEKTALGLRYRPTVSWFADAGVLTSRPQTFYRHFGASAGISLSFPIYDGKQRNLEEKKLSFKENTRSVYNSISRKQYDQQYLRLKGELEGNREVRSRLNAQLEKSDRLVRSLKTELEAGIIRMTDYLNAIRNHRNINRNISLSDIEILNIISEMNYLLKK